LKYEPFNLEANEIQKIIKEGMKFWGLNIKFLTENLETDCVASYYLDSNIIKFHLKYIAANRLKYPKIIDEEIRFMIFHELGHAREARIYEENNLLWDCVTITSQQPLGILKRAIKYILRFINAIDDLKVERKLYENGYSKPRTVSLISSLRPMEQAINKKSSNDFLEKSIALQICPKILTELQFCKLLANEKRIIESYCLKFLGGKNRWKEIVNRLDTIRFGDIKGYKKMIPELFYDLFNYQVKLDSASKKELELKIDGNYFSPIWKKQKYFYFRIHPLSQIFFY
jgi:hypothetical protein